MLSPPQSKQKDLPCGNRGGLTIACPNEKTANTLFLRDNNILKAFVGIHNKNVNSVGDVFLKKLRRPKVCPLQTTKPAHMRVTLLPPENGLPLRLPR